MGEKYQRYLIDFNDIPSERQRMPELEVERRKTNFEEVELGFSMEKAQEEARRCLSCRRCLGCGLCLAICQPKAIVFEQEDELIELTVDKIVIAPEVVSSSPLVNESVNVISAFQFERMLSPHGPYGGVIMRPFDGEVPQKIAFIVDGAINDNGHYLLSYTMQEALSAFQRVEDLAITIFVSNKEKAKEAFGSEIKEGLAIKEGQIKEVKEKEETKNPLLIFIEDGEKREEEFDLVVRAQLPTISPHLKDLGRKLGLSMDNKTLMDTPHPSLIETSLSDIFFAGKLGTDFKSVPKQG